MARTQNEIAVEIIGNLTLQIVALKAENEQLKEQLDMLLKKEDAKLQSNKS